MTACRTLARCRHNACQTSANDNRIPLRQQAANLPRKLSILIRCIVSRAGDGRVYRPA